MIRRTFVLALVLQLGCVSKGRHELVEIQLDATRTALSARQGACLTDIHALDARVAELEQEIEGRGLQVAAMDDHARHLEEELAKLREEKSLWLATLPLPVPEPEPVEKPKKPKKPEPVDPEAEAQAKWIEASVEEMVDALAIATASRVLDAHRAERRAAVDTRFAAMVEADYAEVVDSRVGSIVHIPVAKLFNEGSVDISPLGEKVLSMAGEAIAELGDHHLQLQGHTDDRPVHTAEHASNWELGFDRAVVVLRALEAHGLPMSPTAASFAGSRPIADNETSEGRKANNRVGLWLTPDPDLRGRFPIEKAVPTPDEDGPSVPEEADGGEGEDEVDGPL